jgi:hypothetical protein
MASDSGIEVDRFRSGPDGYSEFVRARIPWAQLVPLAGDGNPFARLSPTWPSPNVKFIELPAHLSQAPHPAPEPQIVLVLSGRIEVETSDGTVKNWGKGDYFIAADHDGIGHATRTLEGPVLLLFVPLPTTDIDSWTIDA